MTREEFYISLLGKAKLSGRNDHYTFFNTEGVIVPDTNTFNLIGCKGLYYTHTQAGTSIYYVHVDPKTGRFKDTKWVFTLGVEVWEDRDEL